MTTPYAFDPTGTNPANKITGERQIITKHSGNNYHFIVPVYAPFFTEGLSLSYKDIDNNIRYLVEGIDFLFCFQFVAASRSCAKPIYGGISFLNTELEGLITLSYQTVGGEWTIDPIQINEILANTARNPRVTTWEQVANVPTLFPVIDHEWNLTDLVGMSSVVTSVNDIGTAIAQRPSEAPPVDFTLIPTKDMIGLGNVENFGVATDQEAMEGTSITKYVTPRGVKAAIEVSVDNMGNSVNEWLTQAAITADIQIKTTKEQAAIATNQATIATDKAKVASSAAAVSEFQAQVATDKANIATTQAEIATTQAGLAVIAKNEAEVARDAAQLSAGVYPTVAAGIAATQVGHYFSVPSTLNTEYLILYRHDANGVATEIQRYPSVAGIEYTISNVIHVKSNGKDTNDGLSWKNAVRTIEHALELAWANASPTLIEWAPEAVVYTNGHLDMPDNCVIKATHRTVFVRPNPGYEKRNVFRMGNGCFIEGIMFEGWEIDSLTNPTEGFAISFRPGAVITRVPYAHKIAVRRLTTWGVVAPPLDAANGNPEVGLGGGVILADGAVCSPYSVFPNIMAWGATPVIPNGVGYCAKNGGLINAVNAVSMWAHRHFMALSGGQIILSACSTQFGDYSLYSSGSRDIVVPNKSGILSTDKFPTQAAAIKAQTTALTDSMWTALVAGGYTVGWDVSSSPTSDKTYTYRDTATLLQCLSWALKTANEQPMQDFAKGLYTTTNKDNLTSSVLEPVFDLAKKSAFLFSFTKIKQDVLAMPEMTVASKAAVTKLMDALYATVNAPTTRKEPSRITAIGHTWTAVMAGVALTKIPPAVNKTSISDSIVERDEGVVLASGQDDQGNALFVGGLEINADTGELGGPPFDQAVRRVATRAAIARSF